MKKVLCRSLVLALGMALVASAAFAKRGGGYANYQRESAASVNVGPQDQTLDAPFASAALTTVVLYTQNFDVAGTCNAGGWTTTDITAQLATFWHVDDFAGANVNAGDSLAVIAGTKSLWCGARAQVTGIVCGYLTLPGYGNGWNQVFRTKNCIPVAGGLDVSFLMETDSESGYDATTLEYTLDCTAPFFGWVELDGGVGVWDGIQGPAAFGGNYAVAGSPVKVQFRFASDGGWSDEDALWDSHAGAVVIDNLTAEGLALENFEGEALNATSANDWEGAGETPYGIHMALYSGLNLLQQDTCAKNLSCMWASISGSTETYACGGFPLQAAVPKGNGENQYIDNGIVSPVIPMAGTGTTINVQYQVYRDAPLDNLVFYTNDVAAINGVGCQSAWRSNNFVYYGDQKDFFTVVYAAGGFVPASSVSMRVRLGIIDMCGVWCGINGSGACHSHAPLIDRVKVYRVDLFGPTWNTRDIDQFQDTFPFDGSDTGIGRANAAISITPQASPTILPGDSARVICIDPVTATPANLSGLATDNLGAANGTKAIYIYVHVIDNGVPSVTKTGAALTDTPSLYPFKDTVVADGKTWTRIQMWRRVNSTSTFVVDLNDNIFQAGDVIEFFYGATSTAAVTTYASGSNLGFVQGDLTVAAQNASEFTILPLNGNLAEGSDILYVDGMDGRGAQGFFDVAFDQLNVNEDRYDVRGPSSGVSNRPGARVTDVATQLNDHYQKIIWDTGDLVTGLGDGSPLTEKSNDYALVNAFLGNLTSPGGVYLGGDDLPSELNTAAGASAVTFKSTYITYTLSTNNARPIYGIAPQGTGTAGGAFAGDTWIIFGGCPLINDFDVMVPTGSSVSHSTYLDLVSPAGDPVGHAEIGKVTGNARVMLAGYSFCYIRDDEENGVLDRALHMRHILLYLNNNPQQPVGVNPTMANRLDQNYPNPFNPQTTISFSLRERGHVKLDVFNVNGELVRTLVDETMNAGEHDGIRWDGRNNANQAVSSGVYFYKLVTNNFSQTKKMVLLK